MPSRIIQCLMCDQSRNDFKNGICEDCYYTPAKPAHPSHRDEIGIKEKAFWKIVYDAFMSIAKAIKTYKIDAP